jgi:glycosyltransferase involved in cell wall biosynthesis
MSSSGRRVAVIGTVGIPARYGGFETLAEQLVTHLERRFEFTVYCSARSYRERPKQLGSAKLRFLPLKATGAQSTPYDVWAMADALASGADALLVLGVSGALALPVLRALGVRTRIVVNIDGLEWQRAKWGPVARRFLRASEAAAVRSADVVVADNDAIARYVQERYGVAPALIEYGADHVKPEEPDETLARSLGIPQLGYAFTVCRIEPENNVHVILESFRRARKLPLVVVGNWDQSRYGRHLKAQYAGGDHTILIDPIYEPKRLNALRGHCSLYVHGHSAGGTNPSLIEAMQLRRPIVAFDVSYNRVTTEGRAAYFRTSAELAEIVRSLTAPERLEMGAALADVAARRYTWSRIADGYARLLAGESDVSRAPAAPCHRDVPGRVSR